MQNNKINYGIDIKQSRVSIINQLLKFKGQTNTVQPLFKKTSQNFERRFKMKLSEAPVIFKHDDILYKLSFIQSRYPKHLGGRLYERVDYMPIVKVGRFFESLKIN